MLNAIKRLAVVVVAIGLSFPAAARDFTAGSIKIVQPWTRVTPEGAKVAGGFMKITNTGKEADTLVGGTFPLAAVFQVHQMTMDGGVMKMSELSSGLEIAPGATVELKPGSYHVMFMDLKQPIKDSSIIKGSLIFKKAGTIEIEYAVEPLGAKDTGHSGAKH
ncbi:MAG: copper chaperone PCu(A)C [Hyphomicrobiaceae bacterium]